MNKEKILKLIDQRIEATIEKLKQEMKTTGGKRKVKIDKKTTKKKKIKNLHAELIDKIKNIRIDSQKYPLVKNNDDILIKCLFILDIIKNEAGFEELTAPQIEVVAPFFNKLKISHQAARGALDRHTEYVSIRREGLKKTFYAVKNGGTQYYKKSKQNEKKK